MDIIEMERLAEDVRQLTEENKKVLWLYLLDLRAGREPKTADEYRKLLRLEE